MPDDTSKIVTHFIQLCKQGEGKSGSAFVRMVNAAPYPMMAMAPDYSLDEHRMLLYITPWF